MHAHQVLNPLVQEYSLQEYMALAFDIKAKSIIVSLISDSFESHEPK